MTDTQNPQRQDARSPFQFNEELYEKLKLLKTTDQADKGALVRECIELLRKHQQNHELPAAPAVGNYTDAEKAKIANLDDRAIAAGFRDIALRNYDKPPAYASLFRAHVIEKALQWIPPAVAPASAVGCPSMDQVVAIVKTIEGIAGVDLGLTNDEFCTIHEAALAAPSDAQPASNFMVLGGEVVEFDAPDAQPAQAVTDGLLPCPRGHAAKLVRADKRDIDQYPIGWHYVDCSVRECGWHCGGFPTAAEAIAAWNERTSAQSRSDNGAIVTDWEAIASQLAENLDHYIDGEITEDDARVAIRMLERARHSAQASVGETKETK